MFQDFEACLPKYKTAFCPVGNEVSRTYIQHMKWAFLCISWLLTYSYLLLSLMIINIALENL